MSTLVRVAAAVILRPDGCVLLAQRPAGKPYEGYWEFPGGKLEPGESPAHALARELHEELGRRCPPRGAVDRAGVRVSTCARRAQFLPRLRLGRRAARARRAGVRVADARRIRRGAAASREHARAGCAASFRRSTGSAVRATLARTSSSRARISVRGRIATGAGARKGLDRSARGRSCAARDGGRAPTWREGVAEWRGRRRT